MASCVARRVRVTGIVQGVGFRPFVYGLARRHAICGQVANNASGVVMHIEGPSEAVAAFCRDLEKDAPPLAMITAVRTEAARWSGASGFAIAPSDADAARSALISPDVTVCPDCLREMRDPADRRYRYPFINCTNCGPRYTIIADIPYDRPATSMAAFTMCPRCQAEYDDPLDRRFHAQPNACPQCGPRVSLCDAAGRPLTAADPVAEAVALLAAGRIVAVKGLGGFHLAVDAADSAAVQRLRERKRRPAKPLALMAADLTRIASFACQDEVSRNLLTGIQRPIVLLPQLRDHGLAPQVAPESRTFGVMLPYTPLHHLLLEGDFRALVMTSGNLSDEPIVISDDEARRRLAGIADAFLGHDRPILVRADDSIVMPVAGVPRPVRRSRGYAPVPLFLDRPWPPLVACGGMLKNTVCLAKEDRAFLSPHIGDLANPDAYAVFRRTLDHLMHILEIRPEVVAHDLHPDYLSTRYAAEQTLAPAVGVQHHHAHIAAVMAEFGLDGPVVGLALDGTGYGSDGAVWGGEVLLVRRDRFDRAAHLAYVPLPGGEAAIREPWRMALSYLLDAYGPDLNGVDLPFREQLDADQERVVRHLVATGLNSPPTSSAGRLFDGVAALTGVCTRASFEGQAAMALETLAAGIGPAAEAYSEAAVAAGAGDGGLIPTAPIIRAVVDDLRRGVPVPLIAARFHATLVRVFAAVAGRVAARAGVGRVVLGGGVFQNALLLEGLQAALTGQGLETIAGRQVPANDGGLALGQAAVAAARHPEIAR